MDSTNPSLSNVIALQRSTSEKKKIVHAGAIFCSFTIKAEDNFHIPTIDAKGSLAKNLGYTNYKVLQEVTFDPHHRYPFYEMVALAAVVTEYSPNYIITDTQCYWYAGSIWECLRKRFPKAEWTTPPKPSKLFSSITNAPVRSAGPEVIAYLMEKTEFRVTNIRIELDAKHN
jgi:hypothetical protein